MDSTPSIESVLREGIGRFYLMPVQPKPKSDYYYDNAIGFLNPSYRSLEEVKQSIQKAESAPYTALYLPGNIFYHRERAEILSMLDQSSLPIILGIQRENLQDNEFIFWLHRQSHRKFVCNYVFDEFIEKDNAKILELQKVAASVYYTFVVHRAFSPMHVVGKLPEGIRNHIYFYFPFGNIETGKYFNCREIHFLHSKLQEVFPTVRFRPAPGLDIFDTRIPENRNLEAIAPLKWQSAVPNSDIEISVVIPSYNNKKYLCNTIKHLLKQDLPRRNFEIILVDDGSNDDSYPAVRRIVEGDIDETNFKYVFFTRTQIRKMGDSQFRAGVARNMGVKHTIGRLLSFLDSDILTPKNFLADLIEKHKHYDVLQAKRIQLKKEVSSEFTRIEHVRKSRDTYITDDGYWEEFQTGTKDWMSLDRHWRFTCTHSLSLPRSLWERIGGFRKNYIFYGYEDTEIGFDLAHLGCRFLLNDIEVFHLDHRVQRSEFFKSHKKKKLLLASSAMTFYHNTLHKDVYSHLEWLFLPYLRFRVYFGEILKPLWFFARPFLKLYYVVDYKIMNEHWRFRAFKWLFIPLWLPVAVIRRNAWWLRALLYPVVKVFYFLQYQLDKRRRLSAGQ